MLNIVKVINNGYKWMIIWLVLTDEVMMDWWWRGGGPVVWSTVANNVNWQTFTCPCTIIQTVQSRVSGIGTFFEIPETPDLGSFLGHSVRLFQKKRPRYPRSRGSGINRTALERAPASVFKIQVCTPRTLVFLSSKIVIFSITKYTYF